MKKLLIKIISYSFFAIILGMITFIIGAYFNFEILFDIMASIIGIIIACNIILFIERKKEEKTNEIIICIYISFVRCTLITAICWHNFNISILTIIIIDLLFSIFLGYGYYKNRTDKRSKKSSVETRT